MDEDTRIDHRPLQFSSQGDLEVDSSSQLGFFRFSRHWLFACSEAHQVAMLWDEQKRTSD
jgi:hypothetical protein